MAAKNNRWWQALRWAGILYALFAVWLDVDWVLTQTRLTQHGDYGVTLRSDPALPMGTLRLMNVRPGGPAEAAGLRDGDQVDLLDRWIMARTPSPGEIIVLRKGDTEIKLKSIANRGPLLPGDWIEGLYTLLPSLQCAFLSLFILLRSGARPSPVILGVALAAYGVAWFDPLPPTL
ncbi:MAG: hypothetical protein WCO83_12565, partial [Alphaproteobacteria bacterium]